MKEQKHSKFQEEYSKIGKFDPINDIPNELLNKDAGKVGKEVYDGIIETLRKYCDLREDYYNIVALWIMGTYKHKWFLSYPYLFFNAMRGSGKTRILKLISELAYNGKLIASLNEAVMFRTAKNSTFCIDEFESVGGKEKASLRELLNAAYKRGMKVERLKKVQKKEGEIYEVEEFEVFAPICMANIWGMEEVLSDRCITLTLEKSTNRTITRLLEIFDIDENVLKIKENLKIWCRVCRCIDKKNIHYKAWNNIVLNTLNTHTTYTTHTTLTTTELEILKFIERSNLDSRNLELFFPLFILAGEISKTTIHQTILTAEELVKEKKEEDVTESRDVSLIDFIAKKRETEQFIPMPVLFGEFKDFIGEGDEKEWLNSIWMGRALKRLTFIIEKRRVRRGVEVRINFKKARDKIKLFKDVEVDDLNKEEKVA